ncbi:transcriptional regulator [Microbacterium sp. CIAB417]|uniref:ArsR/SmtB family transcription factor n=1 Tax=Microbacterium sp. CIAB417 TaxID=2860287 RepID=UPI001FAE1A23|nr:helix-turn-helix domain-containing protein [Microbacterium sp. CIAB417]
MAQKAEDPEVRPDRTMTTAMLKAFANPLRRRIMRVLARREFVRAADIAEDLGEPANKISFHLRVLADAGIIVEAPEQARDGRDRVWTPIRDSLSIGAGADAEEIELGNTVIAAIAEDHTELVRRVVAHSVATAGDPDPGTHATLMVSNLHLTEAEFGALRDALSRLIREAERSHDRSDPDSRMWQIDVVAADDAI